jgi:hypothetical protein
MLIRCEHDLERKAKEDHKLKYNYLIALVCVTIAGLAQEVHFDYDRSANFIAYKAYRWIDQNPVQPGDQLLDRDIKRAVDEQLAGKGLRRVDSSGDLLVGYQAGISREKQLDGFGGWGPPWLGNWGNARVTTSTIDIGTLTIGLFDPATRQLVWRGAASNTLDINRDPDKNYRTLEKAMVKLFKTYPPGLGKR